MTPPVRRCAIYTRKSSEEGLEQGFNSLDAQREACEAYVLSQAGEGWVALPDHYDDGGYSGGSMERPGLQRFLADIRAGQVDVVVVYKIDRLTRSLADFARIVEQFDAREVSFVSVTQAFNTTTSMGRLTLNVLLSFAQFEREVTGERIRDKIAASKAKGMWMGGLAPLGYDLPANGTRALVENPSEAQTVRHIFERYLALGSVHQLIVELQTEGIHSKQRTTTKGLSLGGLPFSRGALFHLLQNRVYVGEIVHKDACYPGQHPAIIDRSLFDQVQARLADNRRQRTVSRRATSPLSGRLFDFAGRRMTPTHSRGARGRTYRYYVSPGLQQGQTSETAIRISAPAIEGFAQSVAQRLLRNAAEPLAEVSRIEIADASIVFTLPARHAPSIRHGLVGDELIELDQMNEKSVRVTIPTLLASRREPTQIRAMAGSATRRDPVLIRALRVAHSMVAIGRDGAPTIQNVPGPRYQRRLVRLAFLSPRIQQAILDGHQPPRLRLEDLVRGAIPASWAEQERWLGKLG
jgi:DNA invertase Pin-like site-specific DNA recombinase